MTIAQVTSLSQHFSLLSDTDKHDWLDKLSPEQLDQFYADLSAESEQSQSNFAASESARVGKIINAKVVAAQEIGPLPPVADPTRRDATRLDNMLFAETYFAATFYLPWAPYQRAMMNRFQSVVLSGGRECHAVRRGGLKSTCARVSTLWAVIHGHRRFPVLVGATDKSVKDHRKNLFDLMASSDVLLQDFPELTPLLLKVRQTKKQFRLNGRLLEVHPKDDKGRIVFADIETAPSCQAHIAPYSILSTDVSGLSYVDRFGVTVRPDLLVFDDVQTPQSARSPTMTQDREDMVTKTFCGLAGLGEKLAVIMVATVREHDDLTERFLSRQKHPDWDGKKYPSIIRMPDRMDMWETYGQKLSQGVTPEEGKRIAQEYFVANEQEMKRGAVVAWEHDKLPDEVSALQSLMTVRFLDPEFFRCEIQQDGAVAVNTTGVKLDAQTLLTRLSRVERGYIPEQASYVTSFIDSGDNVLHWMLVAWQKDFSGWVVDYGAWPPQERTMFWKSDLSQTIGERYPGVSPEEAFVLAHNDLETWLLREWPTTGDNRKPVDMLLKDWGDGGHKPRIESQVLASPDKNRIRPSRGRTVQPGRKPVHLWGDEKKDRHNGQDWIEIRTERPNHVMFDANQWKATAAKRLLTTVGAPGAVVLPGTDERANRMIVEHFTAERPKTHRKDGAERIIFEILPGREVDYWDCFVGNCVAASMLGCGIAGEKPVARQQERRVFSLPGGARR